MPERKDDLRREEHWFFQIESGLHRFARETTSRPRVAIRKSWEPRIDVTEEPTRLVVRAEIPGVRPRDVDVSFSEERHTLVIHGYRPEREEDVRDRTGVYQLEILYGEFEREVRLPDLAVDPAGMKAQFRDGMLSITLPKRERVVVREILTIVAE